MNCTLPLFKCCFTPFEMRNLARPCCSAHLRGITNFQWTNDCNLGSWFNSHWMVTHLLRILLANNQPTILLAYKIDSIEKGLRLQFLGNAKKNARKERWLPTFNASVFLDISIFAANISFWHLIFQLQKGKLGHFSYLSLAFLVSGYFLCESFPLQV